MQHKLVSLQGAAQEPFEGLPRDSPRSHVRLEELEIVASLFLRVVHRGVRTLEQDRKSTRLNSSHGYISYAVFCLKKKKAKFCAVGRLPVADPVLHVED